MLSCPWAHFCMQMVFCVNSIFCIRACLCAGVRMGTKHAYAPLLLSYRLCAHALTCTQVSLRRQATSPSHPQIDSVSSPTLSSTPRQATDAPTLCSWRTLQTSCSQKTTQSSCR